MDEVVDTQIIKKRSLVGVVSLISRSFLIQGIALISNLLLTIFLDPRSFGIFFLVSASINIFRYFSDIGLAAALIQKKEELSEEDLKTTFTIQQFLVGIVTILIFILSPLLKKIYGFDQSAVYLLYSLAISFFITVSSALGDEPVDCKQDQTGVSINTNINTPMAILVFKV